MLLSQQHFKVKMKGQSTNEFVKLTPDELRQQHFKVKLNGQSTSGSVKLTSDLLSQLKMNGHSASLLQCNWIRSTLPSGSCIYK